MTRTDLHNIPGFHAASLLAAATYLRAQMRPSRAVNEPTALIRSEGLMNGYLTAIEDLIASASPQAPASPKKDFQPYAQPAQPENQNRP